MTDTATASAAAPAADDGATNFIPGSRKAGVTFLPEPEARPRHYTVISVDDHLVEPAHLFDGRLPKKFQAVAPRVLETELGQQMWCYEDRLIANFSVNAIVGRPIEEGSFDASRFDEMRRGCWDIDARVHDMDTNGVAASLNFPSGLSGFAGVRYSFAKDPAYGLATMRAYNDWHLQEWAGTHPDRIIACQVTWLRDPEIAAAEIRKNAELGFTAVTFPDNPERLGLPSLHTRHWDPFVAACAETDTVICIHVGSNGRLMGAASDAPLDATTVLFPVNSIVTAVDWLFSLTPVRFPDIKIVLSEGGIGWVPMLMDRLDFCIKDNHAGYVDTWRGVDISPSDLLRRNFYFNSIEDPAGFSLRHRIGIENIMVESDYPHPDSTWPDTQLVLHRQFHDLPRDEVDAITYKNAERVFRHPLPAGLISPAQTDARNGAA
jgi:predicted TIM-barrel fold metal-dependent hydrolase